MNKKAVRLGIAGIILLMAFLIFDFRSRDKEWPGRIRNGTKFSITRLLNVHESAVHVLKIDGKRFEGVRGVKPFYLRVPGLNMIVFVTDDRDHETVFHVFNMDTDEDIAVRPSSAHEFGYTIGYSNRPRCESVEKTSGGQIILCCDDTNAVSLFHEIKSLWSIDLAKKALVAETTIYYDKNGKILDQRDAMVP